MQELSANDVTVIDEPGVSDESAVQSVAAEMTPWFVSLAVHAAMVLLAMFIVWSALQPPKEELAGPVHASFSPVIAPRDRLVVQDGSTTNNPNEKDSRVVVCPVNRRAIDLSVTIDNSPLLGLVNASVGGSRVPGGAVDNTFMGLPICGDSFPPAKTVVYLVDASGSLIDTLPFVITELQRSIGDLRDSQRFTVIFFQGDKAIEPAPLGLRPATAANKERVIAWLAPEAGNVTPAGAANPLPAIRQALKYKPQLVFLLSDNITGRQQYELNQGHLLDEMRRANIAQTRISTIQFIHPDPLTRYGMTSTLERIATENRGAFKFVSADELGIH